ncbi:MAG: hypothetical protein V3V74_07610 [Nitrosomonadaceae bacterium]
MRKITERYKLKVNWSELYGGHVGTCPAFFRGVVCQDQDEFVAMKELIKAVEFKIKCFEDEGTPLPHPEHVEVTEPITGLVICPTCSQKVIRFDTIKVPKKEARKGS